MKRKVAFTLLIAIPWILLSWTITVYFMDYRYDWTTSHIIRKCTNAYPILAWLFGWICCGATGDAFSEYHWSTLLFAAAVPLACVGHLLWGF